MTRFRTALTSVALVLMFGAFESASAITILTFGQSAPGEGIVGNETAGTTVITGTNIPVIVDLIENGAPLAAFFNLSMTSTGAANVIPGFPSAGDTTLAQAYTGTLSLYTGSGMTGTNLLSASFSAGVFAGLQGGSTAVYFSSQPTSTVTFTEDGPITTLNLGRSFSLSFTDLPPLFLTNSSIGDFTADISGVFRAAEPTGDIPVPEPTSMLLLGTGLVGVASRLRRRNKA